MEACALDGDSKSEEQQELLGVEVRRDRFRDAKQAATSSIRPSNSNIHSSSLNTSYQYQHSTSGLSNSLTENRVLNLNSLGDAAFGVFIVGVDFPLPAFGVLAPPLMPHRPRLTTVDVCYSTHGWIY